MFLFYKKDKNTIKKENKIDTQKKYLAISTNDNIKECYLFKEIMILNSTTNNIEVISINTINNKLQFYNLCEKIFKNIHLIGTIENAKYKDNTRWEIEKIENYTICINVNNIDLIEIVTVDEKFDNVRVKLP